ncbi:MAG: hypothetical protein AAFP84_01430 [Actinomycetota bacterium]
MASIWSPRPVDLERVRRRDDTGDTSGAAVTWEQFGDLGSLERHVVSGDGTVDSVVQHRRDALAGDALVLPITSPRV